MALKFKIAGVDASINGTAVTILELDEMFNIISASYKSYAPTKIQSAKDPLNLIRLDKSVKDGFGSSYEQYVWNSENFTGWVEGVQYAAIEDYAFAANGRVFDLAENTSLMKKVLWDQGTSLRKYEPTVIKKFATGNGAADKVKMKAAYFDKHSGALDLSNILIDKDHPLEDIIDSFFIAMLLRIELMLRHGVVSMKELDTDVIWCFNRVSKSSPVNILNQEFIERK